MKFQDPLGICASSANGTEVSARLDLSSTDKCPLCGAAMSPILAAEIPSNVCWDHRIVLPQADAVVNGEAPVLPLPQPTEIVKELPIVPGTPLFTKVRT